MAHKHFSEAELEELTVPHVSVSPHIWNQRNRTIDDDYNGLAEKCPLDNGQHDLNPRFDLGQLEMLPLELLSDVLLQTDVQSLTDFRRVNQRAMDVVNSISQYVSMVKHAPNTLRGILSLNSQLMSCYNLYDKLCTAFCETCGDFGGYISLLTCKRVCFVCVSEKISYLPLLRADALRKFGLDSKSMSELPQIRTRRGIYSRCMKKGSAALVLVDHNTARSAGIARHGSVAEMDAYVAELAWESSREYSRKRFKFTSNGGYGRKPPRPRIRDAFDAKEDNVHRFMAIVSMPYFDTKTQSAEWGLHCKLCRQEYGRQREFIWERRFTEETFMEHLNRCKERVSHSPSRRSHTS